MANGFALGGAAQGIMDAMKLQQSQQQINQTGAYQQGMLGIQQQAQQNEMARFNMQRTDQIIKQGTIDLTSQIGQLKASGKDDASILKATAPWIKMLKDTATKAGTDTTGIDIAIHSALGTPSVNFADLVQNSSTQYGVPQDQLNNALRQESGFNPSAVNPKSGAAGIAQFTPATAKSRGVNAMNPNSAIPGMASYVSDLKKQFGSDGLAWAAYNWGPGNVQQWIKNGSDPKKMPKETQNYVQSVTGKPIEQWLQPQDQQGQQGQQFDQGQAQKLYAAISNPNVPSQVKQVLATRLDQMVNPGSQVQVKVVKDENQNDHVVFIDPVKRTVTDQNGNPYVVPNEGESDASTIAKSIASGKQPPVLTGLYRNGKAVRAALARDNVDLSQLQIEWEAAKKQVQSLNGPQMTRYAGLAHSVVNTIDEVKNISQQMQLSGIPLLNAAKLQTYIQTAGNSPNGQLATRYLSAINTLREEFANLAQGGYAPTEAAWTLANQQINGNYGVKQLEASLGEVQRLIRYRLNGIPNFNKLGPSAPNQYTGAGQPQAPQGGKTIPPQSQQPAPVDWQTYFGAH